MTKLSEKITGKITKEHIAPEPRWKFVLKHVAFWLIFDLSSLVGAVAFSILLFFLLEADFEIFPLLNGSRLGAFLSRLPLIWVAFFTLFFVAAIFGIRHTKKGYRFPLLKLVTANLLSSIVIGGIVYGAGGAERLEDFLSQKIGMYQGFEHEQQEIWSQPEAGLLGGQVISVDRSGKMLLQDFQRQEWQILFPEITPMQITVLENLDSEKFQGHKIKIIGNQIGELTFSAEQIFPWRRSRLPFPTRGDMDPEKHLMRMFDLRAAAQRNDSQIMEQLRQELHIEMPPRPFPPTPEPDDMRDQDEDIDASEISR